MQGFVLSVLGDAAHRLFQLDRTGRVLPGSGRGGVQVIDGRDSKLSLADLRGGGVRRPLVRTEGTAGRVMMTTIILGLLGLVFVVASILWTVSVLIGRRMR